MQVRPGWLRRVFGFSKVRKLLEDIQDSRVNRQIQYSYQVSHFEIASCIECKTAHDAYEMTSTNDVAKLRTWYVSEVNSRINVLR